jgi:hypothetical protein
MRYDGRSEGPHRSTREIGRLDRGSRKRLRRITLRGNWSIGLWFIVVMVLLLYLVVVPWTIE